MLLRHALRAQSVHWLGVGQVPHFGPKNDSLALPALHLIYDLTKVHRLVRRPIYGHLEFPSPLQMLDFSGQKCFHVLPCLRQDV